TNDKERIYLYTPAGLISLRYDGTDRRTHLQVKGQGFFAADEPVPADDIVPSPDGQWALVHIMNQLYLVPMPVVGGEAPTVNVMTPAVPVKRLTDVGADYFGWADGGKTITWAIGPSFFRQAISSVSLEPPKEEKKDEKKDAKKDDDNKDQKDQKDQKDADKEK